METLYTSRHMFNKDQMDIIEILKRSIDVHEMAHLYMRWMVQLESDEFKYVLLVFVEFINISNATGVSL